MLNPLNDHEYETIEPGPGVTVGQMVYTSGQILEGGGVVTNPVMLGGAGLIVDTVILPVLGQ